MRQCYTGGVAQTHPRCLGKSRKFQPQEGGNDVAPFLTRAAPSFNQAKPGRAVARALSLKEYLVHRRSIRKTSRPAVQQDRVARAAGREVWQVQTETPPSPRGICIAQLGSWGHCKPGVASELW